METITTKQETEAQLEFERYESLRVISERMLETAEKKDWADFSDQEEKYQEVYSRLTVMGCDNKNLGPNELKRKETLVEKILSVNKKTQLLMQERMAILEKRMDDETKIDQAYGSQSIQ